MAVNSEITGALEQLRAETSSAKGDVAKVGSLLTKLKVKISICHMCQVMTGSLMTQLHKNLP
jgi:hypothetical protein